MSIGSLLTCYAQEDCFVFESSSQGVENMLIFILAVEEDEQRKLTECLRPEWEDYLSLFKTEKAAKRVFKYHKRLERQANIVIKPLLPIQRHYIFWHTNAKGLRERTEEAKQFAGGYLSIVDHLKEEYELYKFKFVEEGRRLGSSYDILVFVNGKWRIFHRPWAVLE